MESEFKNQGHLSKSETIVAVANNPKIVLWVGDAPNQKALASKMAARFTIAGIVLEKRRPALRKKNLLALPSMVWDRLRFKRVYDSWTRLQQYYDQHFSSWPDAAVLRVADINDDKTREFTQQLKPDLVIVSGTALIKKKLLDTSASIGIINLHTGLSPYVKGGPNCTNWCIANNDWHLVGNTIMWLNAGIDSGNIITSECVDIRDTDDLLEAQKKVMEHAHQLYVDAVGYLLNNAPPYNAVAQSSLGKGNLYLTKMWTASVRKELLKNWANRKNVRQLDKPVTVPLPFNK